MRRHLLWLRDSPPLLLAGFLVLSGHWLWAQETFSLGNVQARLVDPALPLVAIPKATPYLRFSGISPLNFEADQSPAGPPVRLLSFKTGDGTPTDNQVALQVRQPAGDPELLANTKLYLDRARSEWLMFGPGHGKVDHQNGGHVPAIGPVIERVRQQAKAHPQVTRVLKLLLPVTD